jgi:hypothetical protein
MNKDNVERGGRRAVGQGERFVGAATDNEASEVKGERGCGLRSVNLGQR